MKPLFEQITIVGVGLLGGSLAQACRRRGLAGKIVGCGRNRENIEAAKRQGLIDEAFTDLPAAARGSDLIVICTPVGSIARCARAMIPALRKGCILIDVGSVKAPVVEEMEKALPAGVCFVGTHPIAGSEKSGFAASDPDLFENAKCVVTPTPNTDRAALGRVTELWQKLGSTVLSMDASEHDIVYGAVSHLPHIVAFALVNTIAGLKTRQGQVIASYGGNGLKSMSRLAVSEPVMWKDICIFNKDAVLDIIERFEDTLDEIKSGIGREEEDYLVKLFTNARETFEPAFRK
ncbi:MAG: prephenate dehydrogenase [Nitrospinales bacterium]